MRMLVQFVEVRPIDWDRTGRTIYLPLASLPLMITAVFLSMMFLYMEKGCGCCCLTVPCCNIQDKGEVFDPNQEEVQNQDGVEMEEVQV